MNDVEREAKNDAKRWAEIGSECWAGRRWQRRRPEKSGVGGDGSVDREGRQRGEYSEFFGK